MPASFSRRTVLLAGAGLMTAVSGVAIAANARIRELLPAAPVSNWGRIISAASRPPAPVGWAVPLAEIPEGSGQIYLDQSLVVTQPEAGVYQALHSKCPHDNCDVGDIREGSIICFCHGTYFSLTGRRERGPTRKSLKKLESQVVGDELIVTDIPAEGIAHIDRDCSCGGTKSV